MEQSFQEPTYNNRSNNSHNNNNKSKKILIITTLLIVIGVLMYTGTALYSSQQANKDSESSLGSTLASITDTSFEPESLNVKAGQTITWTNTTNQIQSISISQDNEDDSTMVNNSDNMVSPSESFSYTFESAGSYNIIANKGENQFSSKVIVVD